MSISCQASRHFGDKYSYGLIEQTGLQERVRFRCYALFVELAMPQIREQTFLRICIRVIFARVAIINGRAGFEKRRISVWDSNGKMCRNPPPRLEEIVCGSKGSSACKDEKEEKCNELRPLLTLALYAPMNVRVGRVYG